MNMNAALVNCTLYGIVDCGLFFFMSLVIFGEPISIYSVGYQT